MQSYAYCVLIHDEMTEKTKDETSTPPFLGHAFPCLFQCGAMLAQATTR